MDSALDVAEQFRGAMKDVLPSRSRAVPEPLVCVCFLCVSHSAEVEALASVTCKVQLCSF